MSYRPEELVEITANYEKLTNKCLTVTAKGKEKKKLDPKAKVRNRGTVCVPAESAKDKKDHFPINDEAQARNALARVHQYSSVPSWYKGSLSGLQNAVSRKVHSKYPGIGKSDKKESSSLIELANEFAKYAAPPPPSSTPTSPGSSVPASNSWKSTGPKQPWMSTPDKPYTGLPDQDENPWRAHGPKQPWMAQSPGSPAETPAETPAAPTAPTSPTPGHAKSLSGVPYSGDVEKAQRILRDKYHFTGADKKPLTVDGFLGNNTKFALQSFKTEYNMPDTTDGVAIYYIVNPAVNPNQARYATPPGAPAATASFLSHMIQKYGLR